MSSRFQRNGGVGRLALLVVVAAACHDRPRAVPPNEIAESSLAPPDSLPFYSMDGHERDQAGKLSRQLPSLRFVPDAPAANIEGIEAGHVRKRPFKTAERLSAPPPPGAGGQPPPPSFGFSSTPVIDYDTTPTTFPAEREETCRKGHGQCYGGIAGELPNGQCWTPGSCSDPRYVRSRGTDATPPGTRQIARSTSTSYLGSCSNRQEYVSSDTYALFEIINLPRFREWYGLSRPNYLILGYGWCDEHDRPAAVIDDWKQNEGGIGHAGCPTGEVDTNGGTRCQVDTCDGNTANDPAPPPCPPGAGRVGIGADSYCKGGVPDSGDEDGGANLPAGCRGRPRQPERDCAGDPVDLATGELYDRNACLAIDGVAERLSGSVTYEGRLLRDGLHAAGLPKGWTRSYARRLLVDENGYRFVSDALRVVRYDTSGFPLDGEIDDGRITRSDADGLLTFTRALRDGTTEVFDAAGRLAWIRDAFGNVVQIVWAQLPERDDLWLEFIHDDISRRTLTRVYERLATQAGSEWRLVRIREGIESYYEKAGALRQYRLVYDEFGALVRIIDPAGFATRYGYDDKGRIDAICSPAQAGPESACTRIGYDERDEARVAWQVAEGGARLDLDWTRQPGHTLEVAWSRPEIPEERWIKRYRHDRAGRIVAESPQVRQVRSGATFEDELPDVPFARRDYGPDGFLVRAIDAEGVSTNIARNPKTHDVIAVIRRGPDGREAQWTFAQYTAKGAAQVLTDPDGQRRERTFDPETGALLKEVRVGGTHRLETSFEYDTAGRMRLVREPNGAVWELLWSGPFLTQRREVQTGFREDFTTSWHGDRTSYVDGRGGPTTYEHDAMGRVVAEIVGTGASATRYTTSYDALGHPLALVDDADGLKRTTTIDWEPQGELWAPTKVVSGAGEVMTFSYDGLARLRRASLDQAQPDGSARVIRFARRSFRDGPSAAGELTEVRIADQLVERSLARWDGRVAFVEDGAARRTSFTYDGLGWLKSASHGEPTQPAFVETFEHSPLGRRTRWERTNPSASVTSSYDFLGRLESRTSNGAKTTYTYDVPGRRVTVNEGNGLVVRELRLDVLGRIRSLTTGPRVDQWTYGRSARDVQSLAIAVVDRNGDQLQRTFEYDDRARVRRIRELFGSGTAAIVLEREYDGLSRTSVERVPIAAPFAGVALPQDRRLERRYTYDLADRVVAATEIGDGQSRTQSWEYRPHGALARFVDFDGMTTAFLQDPRGQISGVDLGSNVPAGGRPNPSELDVSFLRGDGGEVLAMLDRAGRTDYSYDGAGRLASRTRNGDTVTYGADGESSTYDGVTQSVARRPDGSLASMSLRGRGLDASLIQSLRADGRPSLISQSSSNGQTLLVGMGWDLGGRLTKLDHSFGGKNDTRTLTWSSRSRITSVEGTSAFAPTGPRAHRYGYDARGQLVRAEIVEPGHAQSGTKRTFAYDVAGNRTSDGGTPRVHDAFGRIVGGGITYDGRGNLTSDGTTTFAYDEANRLVRSSRPGLVVEYTYDGLGHLVAQSTNGRNVEFLLDERDEPEVIAVHDVSSGEKQHVLHARGGAAMRAIVSPAGAELRHAVLDERGSIIGELGVDGEIVDGTHASYDVLGARLQPRAAGGFGFAGEWESADGTLFLRARVYHPGLGVFLQRDTFPGYESRSLSLNRHSYGEGDPVGHVDPSGYSAESIIAGVVAGAYDNTAVGSLVGTFAKQHENDLIRALGQDPCDAGFKRARSLVGLGSTLKDLSELGVKGAKAVRDTLERRMPVNRTLGSVDDLFRSMNPFRRRDVKASTPRPPMPGVNVSRKYRDEGLNRQYKSPREREEEAKKKEQEELREIIERIPDGTKRLKGYQNDHVRGAKPNTRKDKGKRDWDADDEWDDGDDDWESRPR